MSSGVILNGGTAENFTLGTVEGLNQQDPSGVAYDAWEPEDLVATVQFLATLDDRLLLPSSNSSSSPVDKPTDTRLLDCTLPSYDCDQQQSQHLQLHLQSGQPEQHELENNELLLQVTSVDTAYVVDVNSATMDVSSSSFEEVDELHMSSSHIGHSSEFGLPGDVSVAGSVALSDIATEENSVSSAAQTPCSTEERSIIRASNKPAHLKRYGLLLLVVVSLFLFFPPPPIVFSRLSERENLIFFS